MAKYKLSDSQKTAYWAEIIVANLKSYLSQEMSAEDFLKLYPHADIDILNKAVAKLITEDKIKQV